MDYSVPWLMDQWVLKSLILLGSWPEEALPHSEILSAHSTKEKPSPAGKLALAPCSPLDKALPL